MRHVFDRLHHVSSPNAAANNTVLEDVVWIVTAYCPGGDLRRELLKGLDDDEPERKKMKPGAKKEVPLYKDPVRGKRLFMVSVVTG